MTLDEYRERMNEDEHWAPGWLAIDEQIAKVYGEQEPKHYGTLLTSRAIFGGDEYLDGISVFQSEHDHLHIITYGMSALYADEKAFGGDYSGWGYEITFKLPVCEDENFIWAINMLGNLARYTYKTKRFIEPFQYISGSGQSIRVDTTSAITALLVVPDTELEGTDTIHGRLDFLQVVGITEPERNAIKEQRITSVVLAELMRADNPYLKTDLSRTKNYC
jgi:hypothetical protein